MKPDNLTRRGFLGSMFAVLTAGLCPPPSHAALPSAARPLREDVCSASYLYDGAGRRCTTYDYDGRAGSSA